MDPRLAIGFVNYTIDFSKVNLANRPGKVDLEGEFADNGGSIQGLNFKRYQLFSQNMTQNINGAPETLQQNS
jgi:iron complex outermembrane receptor protein